MKYREIRLSGAGNVSALPPTHTRELVQSLSDPQSAHRPKSGYRFVATVLGALCLALAGILPAPAASVYFITLAFESEGLDLDTGTVTGPESSIPGDAEGTEYPHCLQRAALARGGRDAKRCRGR